MSAVRDIVSTYRRPREVFSRWIAGAPDEARALIVVMVACGIVFLSQWPVAARKSYLTGEDIGPLIGGSLMAWIFIVPLALYAIAWVVHLVLTIFGGQGSSFAGRMVLFWALLAASPLWLLNGMVVGIIGQGFQAQLIGALGLFAFVIFWIIGLKISYFQRDKG